ncbi:unnamed protein product [Bursaphelenchus okinawaensis]|uniref:Uncharacterized protein n=1 Tax=Bursaphelenchus okinawaensis TaxID=465554 RepID=A0A811L8Z3_9BILA|nr:unnamed protein product [Bursaphelenchus okinawaensis]CAG9121281.1 unnamed protein product [Bursaphelenchus okinawaensis]
MRGLRSSKRPGIDSIPTQSIPIKTVANPIKFRPLEYKTLEIDVEKNVPHKVVIELSTEHFVCYAASGQRSSQKIQTEGHAGVT